MDRYISTIGTMRSVSGISCFEGGVVGVAVREASLHLHARALLWRWTPSGTKANRQTAPRFAQA